jgi:hypothetical protein
MKLAKDNYSYRWEDPKTSFNSPGHPRRWFHCREVIVSEGTGGRIVTVYNDEVHGVKNGNQQSRPIERTTAGA